MENYLKQLIEDLHKSTERVISSEGILQSINSPDAGIAEYIKSVEEYINGIPQPLSEIVEINQEQLPPLEKLDPAQLECLFGELENFLMARNFALDFPDGLPTSQKYNVLRSSWNDEYVFISGGTVHIEFCDYNIKACPFSMEYCACRKIEEEWNE